MAESANSSSAVSELNYFALLKEAKKLLDFTGKKTIRLAVLTDFASQQLIPLLKALAARRHVRLEVYEAGYDSIDMEILNPQSELYAFKPDLVAMLLATPKLKSRLYGAVDRSSFAEDAIDRLRNLWAALSENSNATILQSTYVLPSERAFGNYELKVGGSVGSLIAAVNQGIIEAARQVKNVLLCDIDYLAAEVGRANWFDERLWSMAKTFCRLEHMPRVAKALIDVALAAQGGVVKCVILDLDNTLWGGVIGDDGVNGIKLGGYDEGESFVAFQRFMLELKRRGIILAVASKNDHKNAILPFKEHPDMVLKEEDIAVFVANWDNKADNIRTIQKTLNIGFDSMVFVDDNPFERNIVRQYLPDVIVPEMPEDPAQYIRCLADLNLFETSSYSEADSQRADQYRVEAQRELSKTSFTNVGDYLKSLEMQIKLERFATPQLPRIAQLIQRSNQFNLTTRRYNESACEAMMEDTSCVPFTVTLADKFGDYGLISVIILKLDGDTAVVDQYLMSCRVLQRGVEQFVMNQIVRMAREKGIARIVGHYRRTEKNDMVKQFYAPFGFALVEERPNGDSDWVLNVDTYQDKEVFMTPIVVEI
ncbi:MAG: HAD family hydrolase [Alphaproteobacteria bacterium]|nr:HAD family hydrolase [Alphaproteobacteria bacterium]